MNKSEEDFGLPHVSSIPPMPKVKPPLKENEINNRLDEYHA